MENYSVPFTTIRAQTYVNENLTPEMTLEDYDALVRNKLESIACRMKDAYYSDESIALCAAQQTLSVYRIEKDGTYTFHYVGV